MSCCLVKGNMIFHLTLLSGYLVDMYSKTFYKPFDVFDAQKNLNESH